MFVVTYEGEGGLVFSSFATRRQAERFCDFVAECFLLSAVITVGGRG